MKYRFSLVAITLFASVFIAHAQRPHYEGLLWMKGAMAEFSLVTSTPDGRYVVTASPRNFNFGDPFRAFGLIYMWDGITGELLQVFEAAYGVGPDALSVAISPDGRKLVAGMNIGHYIIWDTQTGTRTFYGIFPLDSHVTSLRFTPDGRYVIAPNASTGGVAVFDPESGAIVRELPGYPLEVYDMLFSPDGRTLYEAGVGLTPGMLVGTIAAIDFETGAVRKEVVMEGMGQQIALSADGRWLAACADGNPDVQVWDTQTWAMRRISTFDAYSVAFTRWGDTLLIAGFRKSNHRYAVSLNSLQANQEVGSLPTTTGMSKIHMTGYGNRLAGAYDQLWYYDLDTRELKNCSPRMRNVWRPGFTPDSRRMAIRGVEGVLILDVATGEHLQTIPTKKTAALSIVSSIAYSPDGRYLAFSEGQGIRVLDATSFAEVWSDTSVSEPSYVEFSHDSQLLTWVNAFTGDGVLFNIATGTLQSRYAVYVGQNNRIDRVVFAYDGTNIFFPCFNGYAKVLDYRQNKMFDGGGTSIAFSPNNQYAVISASKAMYYFDIYARYIRRSGPTWDVSSGWNDFSQIERRFYVSQKVQIQDLVFHPASEVLFALDYGQVEARYDSIYYDGAKIRWVRMHAPNDDSLRTLYRLPWLLPAQVALSPDGRFLAVLGGNGYAFAMYSIPDALVGIEAVPEAIGSDLEIISCAPHPVRDQGSVTISAKDAGPATVQLYDLLGRRVCDVYAGTLQSGVSRIPLHSLSLNGLHVLRVTQGRSVAVKKVLFQSR